VIVVTNLNNINDGNTDSTFYTIHIEQNHQTPDAFPATSEPPEVTLGFGSYKVIHKAANAFSAHNTAYTLCSEGCSGVMYRYKLLHLVENLKSSKLQRQTLEQWFMRQDKRGQDLERTLKIIVNLK
jgi:hypothetical protein